MLKLIHNQLGILLAPFIFVAALTGILYAITPQLESLLYQTELQAPHDTAQPAQPLSKQIAAAIDSMPSDTQIFSVRTPATPELTTRILYQSKEQSEVTTAIFVNPYTLQVQGKLNVYGTSGVLPLRTFLDHLHRNLLLGEYGRLYSELAASWLGFFALTGLLQWWHYRQKKTSSHTRHHKLRLHYYFALVALPMLLFFSVTGLTWSKWTGENITQLRHLLNSDTPSLNLNLSHQGLSTPTDPHAEHHMHMDMSQPMNHQMLDLNKFDEIVTIARQHGLEASALQIKPSYKLDKAWSIEEMNHRWPIQIDAFAVDMTQHQIIDQVKFEDFPLSAKLTRWGVDLHIGVLFGWINQLVLAISGLLILFIIFFAYRAWWSYQRPITSLQLFNQNAIQSWKILTTIQKLMFAFVLACLYFLIPVWVISIVVLQGLVFLAHRLSSKYH